MYPLLFSVTITQVDVPSSCTTKDVPFNLLRQSSQAVSPLKSFVLGKGKNQKNSQTVSFWILWKGRGRHKRIQAVSHLFFWKRENRDTKRIQEVSPWRILFGKGRREWQDIAHFCFQGLKTQKTFRNLLAKEEEERYQKGYQKECVKVVKVVWNASQGLAFIDSLYLVKKTIGRVITFRKT